MSRCWSCGGSVEFVDGGDWAGFRCVDRKCPGWADPPPYRPSHTFENEHGWWEGCSCEVGADHDLEGTPLVRNADVSGSDRG